MVFRRPATSKAGPPETGAACCLTLTSLTSYYDRSMCCSDNALFPLGTLTPLKSIPHLPPAPPATAMASSIIIVSSRFLSPATHICICRCQSCHITFDSCHLVALICLKSLSRDQSQQFQELWTRSSCIFVLIKTDHLVPC